MRKPLTIQSLTDSADAAVHHVRRRHHVGTCAGVRKRLFNQDFQGCIVVHILAFDDAAVPVVGVLTETDIGNQQKAGHLLLEHSESALDDAMVIVGVRTDGILVLGNAEQDHARKTEVADRLALLHRPIDRQLGNPRHRSDRVGHPGAWDDEERHDQVIDTEFRFPDQAPEVFVTPQPASTVDGKTHNRSSIETVLFYSSIFPSLSSVCNPRGLVACGWAVLAVSLRLDSRGARV